MKESPKKTLLKPIEHDVVCPLQKWPSESATVYTTYIVFERNPAEASNSTYAVGQELQRPSITPMMWINRYTYKIIKYKLCIYVYIYRYIYIQLNLKSITYMYLCICKSLQMTREPQGAPWFSTGMIYQRSTLGSHIGFPKIVAIGPHCLIIPKERS